jgi:hypothetical protein
LEITPREYWFPPEELHRSQRTHGSNSPQLAQKGIPIMHDSNIPPPPTAPAVPPVAPQVEPHTKADVSDSEAATMAGWLKQDFAQGRISHEQAQKAFDQLKATPEQRAPDTRTDEQKLLDKHFPPAKPEDFVIRYGEPGQEKLMTPEMKQFDQSARSGYPRLSSPAKSVTRLSTRLRRSRSRRWR